MGNQIFGTERFSAFEVNHKLFYGLFVQVRTAGCKIDEIVGMDKDRSDVPLLPEPPELGNIVFIERFHGPPTGIPAEDLHARAAELEGALDGEGETAGNGDVKADTHSKVQMPQITSLPFYKIPLH
jgi:hypothetical protein